MKKRIQINEFVRFIMRVSLLQIFLISGIISMSYANDVLAQKILESKISMQLEKSNLRSVLTKIEKETGAIFLYHSQLIPKEKVTVSPIDETLEKVLDKLLLPLGITYEADGNHIILTRNNEGSGSSSGLLLESEFNINAIKVTGRVIDSGDGSPIPGVTIIAKGTTTGTVSDIDGNYSLSVIDENTVLMFSFIGYVSQEALVGTQTVIDIKMVTDIQALDEVVVVGYGQQKKSSLTSAIETMKGVDVANRPVVDISNNFAGRIAGVIVTQSNGEPGFDGSSIKIRGIATNGNSKPLLVVDGIYREFSRLDPNSIESYTVLKDAAAVAPYGLAGANGVILVTTKKGKTGAPSLTYNSYVAFQNPTRPTQMVNSSQYVQMRNEAAFNEGIAPVFSDEEIAGYQKSVDGAPGADYDLYPNSHAFQDVVKENAMITYNNLELSGGSEAVKYIASFGYTTQQGQWSSTGLKKYNFMVGLDAQATKTTTVSLKMNGWITDTKYPASGAGGLMYLAYRIPPTNAVYYSNDLWGQYTGGSLVGNLYHGGYEKFQETSILTNFSIEQKLPFIEGLSVKAQISYDPKFKFEKKWHTPIPVYTLNTSTTPHSFDEGFQGPGKANLEQRYEQNKALTYQGYLNYANTFGKHSVTALGVVESRRIDNNYFSSQIINYNTSIDELDAGSSSKEDLTVGGSSAAQQQFGYVYRVAYAFDNRYMFEVTGRYDGHFTFAPGARYSFFPAYSLGWNLGEESFIKNNFSMVDLLKIRGSYGKSGNLPYDGDNLAKFQYLSSYNIDPHSYNFGGTPNQGFQESLQGNPYITWEKATKYNLGFEASLWDAKITIEADVFYETRNQMLINQNNAVSSEYGVSLGKSNAGAMNNRGFEITLGTYQTYDNGLQFNISGNFTYAKNEIVNILETDATYDNPNRRQTGRALNTQFGYEALGYFTADDFTPSGELKEGIAVQPWGAVHPGDLRYADLSGPEGKPDGIIGNDDQTVIGYPKTPQIMFGLMPNVSFKGFDLDLLIQGADQTSGFLSGTLSNPFDGSASATYLQYTDHWTPANTDALYPRLTTAPSANNTQGSSWWIRNAGYVRLKTAQLGYTIPEAVITKLKVVKYMRVYVSGQNLLTWTPGYKEGIDPEAGDNGNGLYYGQQKVVSVGATVKF